jgi:hypothetical protein
VSDEDDAMLWQEVLDEVATGRTPAVRCPFCQAEKLKVTRDPQRTRVECTSCRRFIEGRFQ